MRKGEERYLQVSEYSNDKESKKRGNAHMVLENGAPNNKTAASLLGSGGVRKKHTKTSRLMPRNKNKLAGFALR